MPVNTVGDNNFSISEWFQALPFVTKHWFGATIAMTLSGNFGVISPSMMVWSWHRITNNFELWRALTSFCYAGPFQFPTLVTVYMLYNMSMQYEKGGPFNTGAGGGTADFCFAMIFGMIVCLLTYPLILMLFPVAPVFCRTMTFFVMYIWSKRHPTSQASIWGIPIPGIWLPFAYLALMVFMGNPYYDMLHGIAIAHIYYFLADVFPQVYGRDILVTPAFLIDKLGVGEYRPETTAAPRAMPGQAQPAGAAGAAQNTGGGYNWGASGRRLGRE